MNKKQVLIIYPHWPPSNLAGVHRARLIANFLPELGWHPIILTVDERFYLEPLDPDITKTVSPQVEVIKTKANLPVKAFGKHLIGDIGIRAFNFLRKEALRIIKERAIDFIWIPIPSWYPALLGRYLFARTKTPYGIDYIDPWVSQLADYDRPFSKAWWTLQLAKILEPIAVKKASLISGVSTPYYQPVLDRNFKNRTVAHVGMPYGFDPNDHQVKLPNIKTPWQVESNSTKPLIYAGAFLPKSHLFVDCLFKAIHQLRREKKWNEKVKLFFVGTGNYKGRSIADYASINQVQDVVVEIRERFPFLHILNFLSEAFGVMVIGSTESHYTASKTFQALLSERPVFAVFHQDSSAVQILEQANAANYLVRYSEQQKIDQLINQFKENFYNYINQTDKWEPNLSVLNDYSAEASAKDLVKQLDKLLLNSPSCVA